jgi:hypothetical protein
MTLRNITHPEYLFYKLFWLLSAILFILKIMRKTKLTRGLFILSIIKTPNLKNFQNLYLALHSPKEKKDFYLSKEKFNKNHLNKDSLYYAPKFTYLCLTVIFLM